MKALQNLYSRQVLTELFDCRSRSTHLVLTRQYAGEPSAGSLTSRKARCLTRPPARRPRHLAPLDPVVLPPRSACRQDGRRGIRSSSSTRRRFSAKAGAQRCRTMNGLGMPLYQVVGTVGNFERRTGCARAANAAGASGRPGSAGEACGLKRGSCPGSPGRPQSKGARRW